MHYSLLSFFLSLSLSLLGSNHYGIAGYYTLRAVKQGLIVILAQYLQCCISCLFFIGNLGYKYVTENGPYQS